jgi:hypothetical protein
LFFAPYLPLSEQDLQRQLLSFTDLGSCDSIGVALTAAHGNYYA